MGIVLEKWGQFGDKLIRWVGIDESGRRRGSKTSVYLKQILVVLIAAHLWIFFSNCYGIFMLYFPRITGFAFLLSIVLPWPIILLSPFFFLVDVITSKTYSRRLWKAGFFFSISCFLISFLTFPFRANGPIIPISSFLQKEFITENSKFPLSDPQGIAVDSAGRIYLALQTYSRVQVYSNDGEFLNGWDIDAAGGAFDIWTDDDEIHVLTSRTDRHDIFTPKGELIKHEEVESYEMDKALSENVDGLVTRDVQGNIYDIKSPGWKPEILKTLNNETAVLIQDPIYVWIHHAPQPVWLIGLISLLESMFFYVIIKYRAKRKRV